MREIKTNAKLFHSVLLLGMLASMAACENAGDRQESAETESKPMPTIMNLKGQTEFAKEALAQRLDVPPDSVILSSARELTWRSSALGCPLPGMNYMEALVPGSVIYLQVDKMIYAYHAKFAGEPFYCPRERVESPAHDEGADNT